MLPHPIYGPKAHSENSEGQYEVGESDVPVLEKLDNEAVAVMDRSLNDPDAYIEADLDFHLAMAEVAVGKVAPSPNPSNSRAMTMVTSPFTKPVKIVASAQIREQTVNTFRGPNRSPK